MSYRVWIDPPAIAEMKATPSHVRQRRKRAMLALGTDPRPSDSKALEWPPERFELRRLKLRNWRIVYAVDYDTLYLESQPTAKPSAVELAHA